MRRANPIVVTLLALILGGVALAAWRVTGERSVAAAPQLTPQGDPSARAPSPTAAALVPVEDVTRWTGLLRERGRVSLRRQGDPDREVGQLGSRGGMTPLGVAEVRRKLALGIDMKGRELLAAGLTADSDVGRAVQMATHLLMKKDLELAMRAVDRGEYVTSDLARLRQELGPPMKLIETSGQVAGGAWVPIGIPIDQRSDPEYEPTLRILERISASEIANGIAAFNAQPLVARRAAFDAIETARAAMVGFQRDGADDPERFQALSAAWVRARAVLPDQRAEIDGVAYLMRLVR